MNTLQQRAYTALITYAFYHNGYLSATDVQPLKLSAGLDEVDSILLDLQNNDLVYITDTDAGELVYDFLPALEKAVAESDAEIAAHLQLARVYYHRHLWTRAIAELCLLCMHHLHLDEVAYAEGALTNPNEEFKKESLYLLGQCFEQKGAVQRAREHYEWLLALDYGYRDTLTRLEHLQAPPQSNLVPVFPEKFLHHLPLSSGLQERYKLVRELGRGGAGVVYQAIDLTLRRDVALKILSASPKQSQDDVAAILHEARLAAQLDHPNLIDVYDVNIEARCIVMEFVSGGTLRTLMSPSKALPLELARSIIVQLCDGLRVAHAAGVLHRDIKPENIFITKHHTIKLGDFGIAHITFDDAKDLARLSSVIGTLPYMSPEQVKGEPLTEASDIYALGIVLYEMLIGVPPFTRGDITYHHQYTSPEPPGISAALDAIVLRCLAKDPAVRFQSVEELRHALHLNARDEQSRLGTYRGLLNVALLDEDVSEQELLVLKLKRQALGISEREAHRVEQELGIQIPS